MGRRDRHDDHHKPTLKPAPVPVPAPTPPVPADYTPATAQINLTSGQTIRDLLWQAGSIAEGKIGITAATNGVAVNGAVVSHCRGEKLLFLMKVGGGPQCQNFAVSDLVTRDCDQALYVACLTGGTFNNLDLHAVLDGAGSNHVLYVEREVHGVTYKNVRLSGAKSWALHLYLASGTSDDITFDGLTIDTPRAAIVIADGFSRVTIRNLNIVVDAASDVACLRFGNCADVLIDGFTASGGIALTEAVSGASPQRITFRNGTYAGPRLISGVIPGVTMENVRLA
jgi:hypothetical protein